MRCTRSKFWLLQVTNALFGGSILMIQNKSALRISRAQPVFSSALDGPRRKNKKKKKEKRKKIELKKTPTFLSTVSTVQSAWTVVTRELKWEKGSLCCNYHERFFLEIFKTTKMIICIILSSHHAVLLLRPWTGICAWTFDNIPTCWDRPR